MYSHDVVVHLGTLKPTDLRRWRELNARVDSVELTMGRGHSQEELYKLYLERYDLMGEFTIAYKMPKNYTYHISAITGHIFGEHLDLTEVTEL